MAGPDTHVLNFSSNNTTLLNSYLLQNWTTTEVSNITQSVMNLLSTTATPRTATEHEQHLSMTIFFILVVAGVCILVVHLLITTKLHILPESIAIVIVGAAIGLLLRLFGNWREEEAFPSTLFFLVLLPPIIFESGYNLHKGNFFQNMGSILVFAILGTIISAVIIGSGVYFCGLANLAYKLTLVESFAFGSLISAVDPVATLAIFQALDVDPILYMMVFGESILNDAVSIVLMTSVLSTAKMTSQTPLELFGYAVANFIFTFLASAFIGILMGLFSALLLKWVDLRRTSSLEIGIMLIFAYTPYCLAEGLKLSGIMAILFTGIVMSHYTHLNLSPVTQITIQQTFRTVSFLAETCIFAYLGLAIFSFKHRVELALVVWSLMLCLVGRAVNIFPLSFLLNYFREHKIPMKNQFVMWFSGLRGAIAFGLALHMDIKPEARQVIVTTTLIIVLVTILFMGGGTMPMMKLVDWCSQALKRGEQQRQLDEDRARLLSKRSRRRRRGTKRERDAKRKRQITFSKTKEMGEAVDSESVADMTEAEISTAGDIEVLNPRHLHLKGFLRLDANYLIPFFTRRYTEQDLVEGKRQMATLSDTWYQTVKSGASEDDEESNIDGPGASNTEASSVMETSLVAGKGGLSSFNDVDLSSDNDLFNVTNIKPEIRLKEV